MAKSNKECPPCPPCDAKAKRKKKTKRCPSGYNLYMKDCATTKPFQVCLMERGWAQLSEGVKATWNKQAKKECEAR